jgi:hypothetical protein
LAKGGGSGNPIFGQGVAGATLTAGLGVVEPPLWPRVVVRPPPKAKKKKRSMGFGLLGVAGPPPKGLGVDSATHYGRSGGGRTTPMAKGVVRPPPKAQKKKKKKQSMGFSLLGVARPPPLPWGGSTTPRPAVGGGRIHPQALGGVPVTPKRPKHILRFFFFFFFFFFWAGLPNHPLGHGGGSTTRRPAVGGGSDHPIWSEPPPISFPPLFFSKKK